MAYLAFTTQGDCNSRLLITVCSNQTTQVQVTFGMQLTISVADPYSTHTDNNARGWFSERQFCLSVNRRKNL